MAHRHVHVHLHDAESQMAEERHKIVSEANPKYKYEIHPDEVDHARQGQVARISRHLSANRIRMK